MKNNRRQFTLRNLMAWFSQPAILRIFALSAASIYYAGKIFIADEMNGFSYLIEMPGIFLLAYLSGNEDSWDEPNKYVIIAGLFSMYMITTFLIIGAIDIFIHGESTW